MDSYGLSEDIGGACGEITVDNFEIFGLVVPSQQLEYKVSHMMDKSLESCCGYISVLPGAFSSFKYRAVQGKPLGEYFKLQDSDEKWNSTCYTSNMYLAEDRILGIEVVCQKEDSWRLEYVKGACASTDVPTKLGNLMKQRRRWLNGSFFSTLYAMNNWTRLLQTNHGFFRKFIFSLQLIYNIFNQMITLIAIATTFITMYIIIQCSFHETGAEHSALDDVLYYGMLGVFGFTFVLLIVYSLGNDSSNCNGIFTGIMVIYGVLNYISLTSMVVQFNKIFGNFDEEETEKDKLERRKSLLFGLVSIASIILSAVVHMEIFSVVFSILQYFFMIPTYLVIFQLYAFSNIHDVSWGTRASTAGVPLEVRKKAVKQDNEYRGFRSQVLLMYIILNFIVGYMVITIDVIWEYFPTIITASLLVITGTKLLGCILFRVL